MVFDPSPSCFKVDLDSSCPRDNVREQTQSLMDDDDASRSLLYTIVYIQIMSVPLALVYLL